MAEIKLSSAAFNDHDFIPRRYAKDGENLSPPLTWAGVPDDAEELVLLCEDPDAPSGTFLHWLVTGIDPRSNGVRAGQEPPGGQAWRNGFGEPGWGGPQPPPGDAHRYFFRLYAVSRPLPLPDEASPEDVHRAAAGQQSTTGELVGLYRG